MARTFSRAPRRLPIFTHWLRLESLEDRSLPGFVTAPTFTVGVNTTGFFSQSSHPNAVAVGDFNGDGKMDVVTANETGPGVSLLLGKGNGKFQPCLNSAAGKAPAAIIAVDVNGDGRLDVVTADNGANTVSYLRGKGDGTFKPALTFSTGAKPDAVACADFNGDGRKDLVVANHDDGTLTLLFATATGGFVSGGTVSVGSHPTSVVAADFNTDGKADLASVSGGFDHLDVNLNQGNGTFAAAVNYNTGFVANTVVLGNFNGDSQPDLAVASAFPSHDGVSILLGNSDGSFQTFQKFDAGNQTPSTLAVGDFNGDGKQDVVTANGGFANNSVSVLMGSGTGTLNSPRVFMAGQSPVGVAVADFNSDGILDVVAVNHDGTKGTISMIRGNGDGSFVAPYSLSISTSQPISSGDLTGDGVADLAVITGNGSGTQISVLPGTGVGSFGASVADLPFTAVQVNDVAIRDVNGDQKRDLIATSSLGVSIFLGNGNGTFGARADFPAGTNVSWVTLNDFNGDGKLDAVVANNDSTGSPGGSILLGNGDGTFNSPTSISTGGPASLVETGDFNRDGKADLTFMHGDDTITVLFGLGNGTFGAPKIYSTRPGPGSIGVGDFNRDGKPDLAVPTFFGATAAGSSVKIFTDKTGGTFGSGVELTTDSLPIGVVVTDFNGDGKLDLAVGNKFGRDVDVFYGKGDGTFGAPEVYVVGDGASWLASADFNSDGKPDIAVVNGDSNTITLLQSPASATHFRVNVVPDTTTAGAAFTVVVSALDSQGRLATNFTGTVRLSSTDGNAGLPAAYTFTAADYGVKKFTVTLKTAGTQSITATSGGLTGTDSVEVVGAAATHFRLSTVASTTAGAPFDLSVTALDVFNNVATGYRGTVHFKATDTGALLPPDYAFQVADNGARTFAITIDTAGLQTVTLKDKVKTTMFRSVSLSVTPAALSRFLVTGFPHNTLANAAHQFTVVAQDSFGNTVTDYSGTVEFSVTGGTALLPPDFTFTSSNKGRHVFTATFQTRGAGQSLTATDTVSATITGTEDGITVT